jgi:hypothetical protein
VDEIHQALLAGGYKFEAATEEIAKRGLRISLTKNSHSFHKLPSGLYGLREWYPAIKDTKAKASDSGAADQQAEAPLDDDDPFVGFEEKEKDADASAASA